MAVRLVLDFYFAFKLSNRFCAACFNIASGDVEDAPALDPLAKFEIVEKDGAVFIKGEEATIKANRRSANLKCSAEGGEKIVIVGGFVAPP